METRFAPAVRHTSAALLFTLLVAAPAAIPAQPALTTIAIVQTTRSAQDWPLQVADKMGFFAANGVKIEAVLAGSSAAVAQQLAAGSADIGTVSTTQVIEAIQGGAPLVEVLRNVVTTPYTVVGRKGITSMTQLKGKTIMIGGPNDITRVMMDTVMAAYKYKPEDYIYTYAGAPAERYAALTAGAIDATVVLPPITFRAESEGFPILDDVQKYYPTFPTSGYTSRRDWLRAHPDLMVAFAKSFLQGIRFIYDPANKAKAIEILEAATNTKPDDALRTYELYTSRKLFTVSGRYDPADFAQVVDVLVKTRVLAAPAPPASKFYDNTWVDKASAELRAAK